MPQEIKPLVSDEQLIATDDRVRRATLSNYDGLAMVRDHYEADRAASRLLIEKLVKEVELLKQGAASMVLSMAAHPDCEDGSEFDDISSHGQRCITAAEAIIDEANAFLKQ